MVGVKLPTTYQTLPPETACYAVQMGYNFTTILEGKLKMPPYNRKIQSDTATHAYFKKSPCFLSSKIPLILFAC